MKKFMFLGLVVLGSSLMSFSSSSVEETTMFKPKLVNYMCESGEFVQYYEHPSYSEADYQDIRNQLCN